MTIEKNSIKNTELFKKLRLIANPKRFRIIELTQNDELDVSQLSTKLCLAYNKCSNYITSLEKEGLIRKRKSGKETMIKSAVKLEDSLLVFE